MPYSPRPSQTKAFAVLAVFALISITALLTWFGHSERPRDVAAGRSPASSSMGSQLKSTVGLPSEPRSVVVAQAMSPSGRESARHPSDVPDLFVKFANWAERYTAEADPAKRAGMVGEGVMMASERRIALKDLIRHDPRRALQNALPWSLRNAMPEPVVRQLEERVSTRADYSVVAVVRKPGDPAAIEPIRRSAIIGGKPYRAYVYGRREGIDSKRGLPVDGIALDGTLAVSESPAHLAEPGEPLPALDAAVPFAAGEHSLPEGSAGIPVISGGQAYQVCCAAHAAALQRDLAAQESTLGPALASSSSGTETAGSAWTQGAKSLLVIRVDFSDVPGTPQDGLSTSLTPSFLASQVNGDITGYFNEVSYHKASMSLLTSDVTPVFRMPSTGETYATGGQYDQMRLDALALATTNGFTPSNYDRVALVFSNLGTSRYPASQFTFAGFAQVADHFSWFNGDFSATVAAHEFGHNYGLRHANLWQIPGASTDPVDPAGSSLEYGDEFDLMGGGTISSGTYRSHFNPWLLTRLEWLPAVAVQTITGSGTYRVYRFDHSGVSLADTLALKLERNATQRYWISYRRKYAGHPTLGDAANGACLNWGYDMNHTTELIDVDTPGTDAKDAPLNVGSTFNDPAAGLHFTVTAAGGSGLQEYLDINVTMDPRIAFSQSSYDVDEAAGTVNIVLKRTGSNVGAVSVNVTTSNGTATAPADFGSVNQLVTWASGDGTDKTVPISIVADGSPEGSESFQVSLSSVSGGIILNGSSAEVTIHEPGSVDPAFVHAWFNFSSSVQRMALQPDGAIAFVGRSNELDTTTIDGVGRLLPDGSTDDLFNQGAGANVLPVNAMARQADGKLVIGGDFSTLRGQTKHRVARLNADGSLDTSFDVGAGPNGKVNTVAIQPDGRILIGGVFTQVGGTARRGIARLHPDGSLDTTFLSSPISQLSKMELATVVLQPDGRVLVGGLIYTSSFQSLFDGGFSSGILRLNANGTVDTSFDIGSGAHSTAGVGNLAMVQAIALQPDGKVLAGGDFTAFHTTTAARLVRLTSTGAVDAAFNSALGIDGANDFVRDFFVQGDGRILVCGDFTQLGGSSSNMVGRLLASGAKDTTFDAGINPTYAGGTLPNTCYQALMQPDTRILLALAEFGDGQKVIRRVFSAQSGPTGVIQFAPGTVTVSEGGTAQVQVQRVGGTLGQVSISYATIPGSAGTSDFASASGTLVWADGDGSPKTISIPAALDATTEATEFFAVQLATPIGGATVGENSIASVAIEDVDTSTTPAVQFAAAASNGLESAGTVNVLVQLSIPATANFTVPFSLGGTATEGAGADYTAPPSPVSFTTGETQKVLTFTILQDAIKEPAETIVITLGSPSGSALLGAQTTHTLTLIDDDGPPVFIAQPASQIVAVGQAAGPFTATADGTGPIALQWRKGTSNIAGATAASYSIPVAALSHAGAYSLRAKNAFGTTYSAAGQLAVVDAAAKSFVLAVNATATIKVTASGTALTFLWKKDGLVLPVDPRITGTTSKSLVIKKLTLADAGTYTCDVTGPGGTLTAGANVLTVYDAAPEIAAPVTLPDGVVGGAYSFPIPVNPDPARIPTSYAASGLPSGLKINTKTGEIYGTPTKGSVTPYGVTLTASNSKGKSTPVTTTLKIDPLPDGSAGVYAGPVKRNAGLNGDLGGRIDLTVATTGSFSGKLTLGGTTYSYKGVLDAVVGDPNPTGSATITRKGKPSLVLSFTIDSVANRLKSGQVTDSTDTAILDAWRNVWVKTVNPPDMFKGYYTFGLDVPPPLEALADIPQGTGYGSFTVSTTNGTLKIGGKTADGTAVSCSTFVGPLGEVLLFQTLLSKTGSVLGTLDITPGTAPVYDDNTLAGTVSWSRAAQTSASARTYKAGFGPIDLNAFGGRYVNPGSSAIVMGLPNTNPNASVLFVEGGVGTPAPGPDLDFYIKPGGAAVLPLPASNPRKTTFKVTPSTGVFSGGFTLLDPNPLPPGTNVTRKSSYYGLVISNAGVLGGYGFFLLPQLPQSPPETPSTTPILSGGVLLEAGP